jgi:hypothetical protein
LFEIWIFRLKNIVLSHKNILFSKLHEQTAMKIANPIYDVVFKYLMEDNQIAKDILETLLKINIISLVLKPQEVSNKTRNKDVRIFRIDFKAVIQTISCEYKSVLIEIQKAKKLRDFKTGRFRRYLGRNYMTLEDIINEKGVSEKAPLPLVPIYFLGFNLKNVTVPIVKVERVYKDASSEKVLKAPVKEPFIETLSHDLFVIQIPRLKMEVKTELEKVLDVFSQVKYSTNDSHVLEYTGDLSNPKVERIVKRLNAAILDDELLEALWAEEEVNEEFEELEAQIEEERKAKEEERKAKENALLEKEQAEARISQLEKQVAMLLEKMNPS